MERGQEAVDTECNQRVHAGELVTLAEYRRHLSTPENSFLSICRCMNDIKTLFLTCLLNQCRTEFGIQGRSHVAAG